MSLPARGLPGLPPPRTGPTERYPYGLDRAEELAGIGIAVVIWASAAFAGYESIRKLVDHGSIAHVALGIIGRPWASSGTRLSPGTRSSSAGTSIRVIASAEAAALDDRFSARRGTYRIICRVDDRVHVVTVVDVARRRDAYRT
jgi:Cation efflux family